MTVQGSCTGPEALVPGALRGYRSWEIGPLGYALHSTAMGFVWPNGVVSAECARFHRCSGPVPNPDCGCGIYGWYRPGSRAIVSASIFGVIEASGRLLLGTRGFRAERARVVAICPAYAGPQTARLMEFLDYQRSLGVDVHDTIESLVAAYPPDDVSALGVDVDTSETTFAATALVASFTQIGRAITRAHDDFMKNMQRVVDVMRPLTDLLNQDAPPDDGDVRQRALEARRTRNTGPKSTGRPPKTLGPR